MEFVEACRQMIGIDSTPASGNREIARWAAARCRDLGLHVEEQEEFAGGIAQANVIARPTSERPSNEFLFQTHLDTTDPGPFSLWDKTGCNPFDAHIIEGNIYGLGAADVKLDFLCKLEAIASFGRRASWKLPPVLVGTYGEETGMHGALKLIRKNKVAAKMALIGEASDLQLISAAKGFASVEIRLPFSVAELEYRHEHNLRESTSTQSKLFTGKPSHSSTPHLGDSAITKLLDYLLLLPESLGVMEIEGGSSPNTVASHAFLEIDMASTSDPITKKITNIYRAIKELENEFSKYNDADFYPSKPTLSIGMIRTHDTYLQISGTCRIPPVINQETYESWMTKLLQVTERNGGTFTVNDYKKPFRTDSGSMLVRGCLDDLRSLGLKDAPISQASTNEASLFSRLGVSCVCFGPGKREGNLHTPQEHVSIKDLQAAVSFYKKVIERFCL